MKIAAFIVIGVIVAGIAYSAAPDLVRYMKIRSM